MRLKLLDEKNCRALLPPVHGLPIDRLLDEYLHRQVNDLRGDLPGSVNALITYNKSTSNLSRGSQRLCNSPIEIALIYNVANREVDLNGIDETIERLC